MARQMAKRVQHPLVELALALDLLGGLDLPYQHLAAADLCLALNEPARAEPEHADHVVLAHVVLDDGADGADAHLKDRIPRPVDAEADDLFLLGGRRTHSRRLDESLGVGGQDGLLLDLLRQAADHGRVQVHDAVEGVEGVPPVVPEDRQAVEELCQRRAVVHLQALRARSLEHRGGLLDRFLGELVHRLHGHRLRGGRGPLLLLLHAGLEARDQHEAQARERLPIAGAPVDLQRLLQILHGLPFLAVVHARHGQAQQAAPHVVLRHVPARGVRRQFLGVLDGRLQQHARVPVLGWQSIPGELVHAPDQVAQVVLADADAADVPRLVHDRLRGAEVLQLQLLVAPVVVRVVEAQRREQLLEVYPQGRELVGHDLVLHVHVSLVALLLRLGHDVS
mmetsp:Transcript_60901/g.162737  ORF Transcript_60901/g.162737 Transcript_60901/m.162737 type:complete len:394 (+) Transcript_60901:367-1548(+)